MGPAPSKPTRQPFTGRPESEDLRPKPAYRYLFYKLCRGNYASYNTFDFCLMIATAPLPFMLNTYW